MEIRPGMPQRIQRMRAKYSPDRFGGLADICGVDTGIGRKPRHARSPVNIRNGCVQHHGLVAFAI
jgi:hypothetical protein